MAEEKYTYSCILGYSEVNLLFYAFHEGLSPETTPNGDKIITFTETLKERFTSYTERNFQLESTLQLSL